MILTGDVGGTKTRLAWCSKQGLRLKIEGERFFNSRDYPSFEAVLEAFLKERRNDLAGACFGIAGPVAEGRSQATNLPWMVDARALERLLGLSRVGLLNDLEAMAYGTQVLPEDAVVVLNSGQGHARGSIGILAAGTGLGEAALIWNGEGFTAMASEGGHADFAPRNELEFGLLQFLSRQHGHVSYERVLSGPGKIQIYEYLKQAGLGEEPGWLAHELSKADPSPVISEMALNGKSKLCAKALELFVSIYGAEAGNLALKVLARGGIYLGGGIAPSILPLLRSGVFMKAFTDKGRFEGLLRKIPVRVILDERASLYGAAHHVLTGCGITQRES